MSSKTFGCQRATGCFSNLASGLWQLQQNNAPAHTTVKNTAFIAANVSGGQFLKSPANSPNLSPIETVWAWMDATLKQQYKPKNVEELKECLKKVRQPIPVDYLEALFDGMDDRMTLCIDLDGEQLLFNHIGKCLNSNCFSLPSLNLCSV